MGAFPYVPDFQSTSKFGKHFYLHNIRTGIRPQNYLGVAIARVDDDLPIHCLSAIEIFTLCGGFRGRISYSCAQKRCFQQPVCGNSGGADFSTRSADYSLPKQALPIDSCLVMTWSGFSAALMLCTDLGIFYSGNRGSLVRKNNF